MKTRIDIISGYCGSGKTKLISRMLQANQSVNERAAPFASGSGEADALAAELAELIDEKRPGRILLETTGTMLLKNVPSLFRDDRLAELAYPGTPVFVMDGHAFHRNHDHLQSYYISQIEQATVVFINRIDTLDSDEKLAVLGRIWEINRHVHLMVAPLHGLDLWKVFDLPPAPQFTNKFITCSSK